MTRAQIILEGENRPLRQALREGLQSVEQFSKSSERSLGGMGASVDFLTSKFGLLVSALAGGVATGFITSQIDMMDALDETAQKTGVSAEALSEYAYAARFASLDIDDLTKTFVRLSGTLQDAKDGQKEAVELFNRLKLDPSNIKDADAMLMKLADRFGSMPDGVAKTALAIDVFGEKLGPKLLPLLADGAAGLAKMREEAHQLGATIDNDTAASAARLNDQMDRMSVAVNTVGLQIAQRLVPGLSQLLDLWVRNTKEAGLFGGTLTTVWDRLKMVVGTDEMTKQEGHLRMLSGRMRMLVTEMERLDQIVKSNPNAALGATVGPNGHGGMLAADRIKQLRKEYEETAKAADLLRGKLLGNADATVAANSGPASNGLMGPPAPQFVPKPKPVVGAAAKKSEADPSRMAELEAMLAKEKQVLIESGLIREYEAQQELDFWKRKSQMADLNGQDRLKIERKVAQLSYEVRKQSIDQGRQLDEQDRSQAAALAMSKLETEMAGAQVLLDNDAITKAQFLQLQIGFEQRKYEIERAAMEQRLALMATDPNASPVEAARVKGELLLLEQKFQRDRMATLSQMEQQGSSTGLFNGMGNSFAQGLEAVLTRTKTWGQAVMGIFQDIGMSFIRHLVTEPVGKYIAAQATMLAAKMGFIGSEIAAEEMGSAASVGIKGAETTAVVGGNAVQAGSGAAAAMAGIPYIGPILALAAMATVFAAVSGLGKKSASRGYDIPTGVNPLTQLHEEEMVLPKHIANPMRDMLAGGGMGGGGGDNINIHVNAVDARGVAQFFRGAGGDAMVREMSMRRRSNRAGG